MRDTKANSYKTPSRGNKGVNRPGHSSGGYIFPARKNVYPEGENVLLTRPPGGKWALKEGSPEKLDGLCINSRFFGIRFREQQRVNPKRRVQDARESH